MAYDNIPTHAATRETMEDCVLQLLLNVGNYSGKVHPSSMDMMVKSLVTELEKQDGMKLLVV